MGQYTKLKSAVEAAEQALTIASDDMLNAALNEYMKASKAWLDYVDQVDILRRKFSLLEEGNRNIDTCICAENAGGVYHDGHDDNDLEYWYVMIAMAEEQMLAQSQESAYDGNC